jgi:hypothetical protein
MKKYFSKNSLIIFFGLLFILQFSQSVSAQSKPYTPAKGSAERKAIMKGLKQKFGANLVFTPTVLKVQNGWAWVITDASSADGSQQLESVAALLQKKSGSWKVVAVPCLEEDCGLDAEIKKIRKQFPKAPAGIFKTS